MSQCCTSLPCTGWAELCTTLSHAFTFFLFPSLFCAPERLPAKCAASLLLSPSIACAQAPAGITPLCRKAAEQGPAPQGCSRGAREGHQSLHVRALVALRLPSAPSASPLPPPWVPPLALRGTGWCLSAIFLQITFFK